MLPTASKHLREYDNIHQFVARQQAAAAAAMYTVNRLINRHPSMLECSHTYQLKSRCQDDPNGCPTRELEETTRASSYHVAEHRPVRSESLQPYTERSSRPGSEPSSVAADVYLQCYTVPVVHARKEEEEIFESHWW